MTRRRFLPLLIVGTSITGLAYFARQLLKAPAGPGLQHLQPRFPRRKRLEPARVSLPPGFYLHQRSRIVHYVNEKGEVNRVHRINEKLLTKVDVPVLPATGKQHLELDSAARVFETLARAQLRAGDVASAVTLLENGIQYDLRRLRTGGNPQPSFSVYDLLARESVRGGKEEILRRIVEQVTAQQSNVSRLFNSRVEKWTDKSSAWYKKVAR